MTGRIFLFIIGAFICGAIVGNRMTAQGKLPGGCPAPGPSVSITKGPR